jgi:hypothetical protein
MIGRADEHVIGHHRLTIGRLGNRHLGAAADNFGQQAALAAAEMGYDHEPHAAVAGQVLEQRLQRLDASRRGPDADYRKLDLSPRAGASAGRGRRRLELSP